MGGDNMINLFYRQLEEESQNNIYKGDENMIVSPYTHDIDLLLAQLFTMRDRARKDFDKDVEEWVEMVISIVKEWKFDNSQLDFRNDHYRQAVSFLMRFAEECGETKNDSPEYFEARFFDRLKCYKAIERRFKERYEKGKQKRGDN